MIRIKPEQDVKKRIVGVFRFDHLFQSSVFNMILQFYQHVSNCIRTEMNSFLHILHTE